MRKGDNRKINILVTVDENYTAYLNVMLSSLIFQNRACFFEVYLLCSCAKNISVKETEEILADNGRLTVIDASGVPLDAAPTTQRYPKEIYYRIFAAKYLPEEIDKVLYLDPDIIINGSVEALYDMKMDDYFFAAASHTGPLLRKINEMRLDMEDESPYINSGVMMMNLKKLRKEQRIDDVFEFIEKRKKHLMLPDQDIISALYGSRILALDTFRYNMTERLYMAHLPFERGFDLDWVRKNSVIIHYCGRNKPWKSNYMGHLNVFYNEAVERMKGEKI